MATVDHWFIYIAAWQYLVCDVGLLPADDRMQSSAQHNSAMSTSSLHVWNNGLMADIDLPLWGRGQMTAKRSPSVTHYTLLFHVTVLERCESLCYLSHLSIMSPHTKATW